MSYLLRDALNQGNITRMHNLINQGAIPTTDLLMTAINNDDADAVNLLISYVNPNAITGFTPLHAAMRTGNNQIISMLLAAGANTDVEDNNGMLPEDYYPSQHFQYISPKLLPLPPRSGIRHKRPKIRRSYSKYNLTKREPSVFPTLRTGPTRTRSPVRPKRKFGKRKKCLPL